MHQSGYPNTNHTHSDHQPQIQHEVSNESPTTNKHETNQNDQNDNFSPTQIENDIMTQIENDARGILNNRCIHFYGGCVVSVSLSNTGTLLAR